MDPSPNNTSQEARTSDNPQAMMTAQVFTVPAQATTQYFQVGSQIPGDNLLNRQQPQIDAERMLNAMQQRGSIGTAGANTSLLAAQMLPHAQYYIPTNQYSMPSLSSAAMLYYPQQMAQDLHSGQTFGTATIDQMTGAIIPGASVFLSSDGSMLNPAILAHNWASQSAAPGSGLQSNWSSTSSPPRLSLPTHQHRQFTMYSYPSDQQQAQHQAQYMQQSLLQFPATLLPQAAGATSLVSTGQALSAFSMPQTDRRKSTNEGSNDATTNADTNDDQRESKHVKKRRSRQKKRIFLERGASDSSTAGSTGLLANPRGSFSGSEAGGSYTGDDAASPKPNGRSSPQLTAEDMVRMEEAVRGDCYGEKRIAILFEEYGTLGQIPQPLGNRSIFVPDGCKGCFSKYSEEWRFEVTHGKDLHECDDGKKRPLITWTIIHPKSGEVVSFKEEPLEAMTREKLGRTICNKVFRQALKQRKKDYERLLTLEQKKRDPNPLTISNLEALVETLGNHKFAQGPLVFGLYHTELQMVMNTMWRKMSMLKQALKAPSSQPVDGLEDQNGTGNTLPTPGSAPAQPQLQQLDGVVGKDMKPNNIISDMDGEDDGEKRSDGNADTAIMAKPGVNGGLNSKPSSGDGESPDRSPPAKRGRGLANSQS